MPPRLFIERGWADGADLEYAALLRDVGGSCATAETVRSAPVAATGTGVVLAPALTKGARLDLVVRKATELGAAAIHPLLTRRAVPRGTPVVALLGPEGGFDPEEAEAARTAGFTWVGLGPRVLRAETAALAALAVLAYEIDR